MTVVVLGWDALDYDLVRRWDMAERFGPSNVRLRTFTNDTIGKPHTYEVWPSIVTGVGPDEHGVHAERYTHGGSWENPLLNVAAIASKYVVPDRLRWAVGRYVRDHGAEFAFEDLDYYRDRDIWTVFDGRQSFPLAIPNARSEYDDALGLVTDRGASLAEFMDIETGADGETVHVPSVDLETFATRLDGEVAGKMGVIRQAVAWDYDLVFVWLGYLDTVGHVAPTVDDAEAWVRDGYETAAMWTTWIREEVLGDGDLTVCVSDHGLKDGAHTPDAFFGWWRYEPPQMPESVLDVAETIHHLSPQSDGRKRRYSASDSAQTFADVDERLKALGYK